MQGALDLGLERMHWSDLQQAIFAEVEQGESNLAIEARAGTGKTTVLAEAVRRLPRRARVLVVAFNASIAKELTAKMPRHVTVKTTHSLGLAAIRANAPRTMLRADLVRDMLRTSDFFPASAPWRHAVGKMVARAMATLAATPGELLALIAESGVVLQDLVPVDAVDPLASDQEQVEQMAEARESVRRQLVDAAQRVLVACGERPELHSFDGMLWLPVVHGWRPMQADVVVVDEAQDLSRVQLELLSMAMAPGARLIVVGDPRQAIYAFRGADRNAFPGIVERFACKVLPLSITYRCPRSVVALAQKLVPDYQAGPGAPEGEVRTLEHLPTEQLQAGDFVLSRKNAPLVRHAIRALAAGKPAAIAGRDLAQSLGTILRGLVARLGNDRLRVVGFLREKYDERIKETVEQDRDPQTLQDELACLLALLNAQPTPQDAADLLDRLCVEKPSNCVLFSSVHRAKGLERPTVYVLASTFRTPLAGPTAAPLGRADESEEENLFYVAITRAQRSLVLVGSER